MNKILNFFYDLDRSDLMYIFTMLLSIVSGIIFSITSEIIVKQNNKIKETVNNNLDGLNNLNTKYHNKKKKEIVNKTICQELYEKKSKEIRKSLIGIIFFIAFFLLVDELLNDFTKYIVSIFSMILCCLIVLNHILLRYRIKKGYFGTNYHEAKELVYYIKNSNDNNRHKGKKIFNEIENNSILSDIADKIHIGQEI